MSKDVQYKNKDVLCKSGTSSVQTSRSSSFGTGKYHPKIRPTVAYGRLQKSFMKYQRRFLVSKSLHFKFMIYIRESTNVSILVQIPCQQIEKTTGTYKFPIKFWQNMRNL